MKKRTKLSCLAALSSFLAASACYWSFSTAAEGDPAAQAGPAERGVSAMELSSVRLTAGEEPVVNLADEVEISLADVPQPESLRDQLLDAEAGRHGDEREERAANTQGPRSPTSAATVSTTRTRQELVDRLRRTAAQRREAAWTKAEAAGIPTEWTDDNGSRAVITDFDERGPVYKSTMNWRASFSTGANRIRRTPPYNVDGSGISVGVWDAGEARYTHQELRNRVNRPEQSGFPDDHATHVAGTIAAAGVNPEAMGMAPGAIIETYDWEDDFAEMAERGAAYPWERGSIPLSNHSYGIVSGWHGPPGGPYIWLGDRFGYYTIFSQGADEVANSLPYYLSVWAAGNDRGDNPTPGEPVGFYVWDLSGDEPEIVLVFVPYDPDIHPAGDGLRGGHGFNSISDFQTAKNVLVVGAARDAVNERLQRDPDAAEIAEFSSIGPTRDGRLLPHVVGGGVSVLSPVAFIPGIRPPIPSNIHYDRTWSGTSMAAPSVTGSLALLADYYRSLFPGHALRASTVKALVVNTADDSGIPGPDVFHGYGLMNTFEAAEQIRRFSRNPAGGLFREEVLTSGQEQNFTYEWDGKSPIRITLAWNDPAYELPPPPDEPEDPEEERLMRSNGIESSAFVGRLDEHEEDEEREIEDEVGEGFEDPVLVNNLDIRVIGPDGTIYQPYVLDTDNLLDGAITGKNDVDNLEHILIDSPTAGNFTVVVSHDGELKDDQQIYSLVVSGVMNAGQIPAPQVIDISPNTFETDTFHEVTITGGDFLLGTRVWLTGPGGERVDATGLEVLSDQLVVRFDMFGQPRGSWDLTVRAGTGPETTVPDAIELQQTCNFEIAPERRTFTHLGGEGTIDVLADENCSWTATADVDWIEIVSVDPGSGAGTVTYRVLPWEAPPEEPDEEENGDLAANGGEPETLDEHEPPEEEDPEEEDERPDFEFEPREGTIIVAGLTHTVVQTNPEAEGWIWENFRGGRFFGDPALTADSTIYIGNDDGHVYALDPAGKVKWQYKTQGAVRSSPTVGNDGTVYFGSDDAHVYALRPDGSLRWRFRTGFRVRASPALGADGAIYIGSWDGRLYALNPNGSVRWTWNHGTRITSSVAVAPNGVLYVGSGDGSLYSLNPDGSVRWSFRTEGSIESSPAIDNEGNIYVGSNDGRVYSVRPDGSRMWRFETGGPVVASPVIGFEDMILVGSTTGTFYALQAWPDSISLEMWSVALPGAVVNAAALGEDGSIFVGAGGILNAFRFDLEAWELEDLGSIWTGMSTAPVLGPEGVVYFGSTGWIDAFSTETGPELTSWSHFQANPQRTGRHPGEQEKLEFDPPEILTAPSTQWTATRGHAIFEVEVESESEVTYQWRFNGNDLPNQTGPRLILPNVRADQAGFYSVLITSAGGAVESEAVELIVDGVTDYDFKFDVDHLLWDLTGEYEYQVEVLQGIATLSYTLTQDARGGLSGAGTVRYEDPTGRFSAPIDVRGRIRGARHVARGTLDIRSRGDVDYQGESRRHSLRVLHRFEVEPWFNELRGPTLTQASLQGVRSQRLRYPAFGFALPAGMDGTWRLDVTDVQREGRGFTGTAQAILSNERVIDFNVRGVASRGAVRLILTGAGIEHRRNRLTITLQDGEPVAFRGRILGQTP